MSSHYNLAVPKPSILLPDDCWPDYADMEFVAPKFKRGQIDRAGDTIVNSPEALEFFNFLVDPKFEAAREVVENWRSSHGYPMQIMRNNLVNRARKYDSEAIVAQRLKRFSSIASKLEREPSMKLSQMQDIGGCRAILSSVEQVDAVVGVHQDAWTKNPHRHELHRCKDYIAEPKASGYRGVHIIYKFRSLNARYVPHNGQRIEVQIRSRIQHIWATAVEVVGAFTKQALKSSQGSEDWQRLFALMGSILANKEGRAPVPDTPSGAELISEIQHISRKIKADEFLSACSSAAVHVEQNVIDAAAYLLILDVDKRSVNITPFNSMLGANVRYAQAERENRGKEHIQTVLVSVDSIGALRSAYPNYYLDVSEFLSELRAVAGPFRIVFGHQKALPQPSNG